MNDNVISKAGVDLGIFPNGIPIYSGHFHKPHTLSSKGRRLTYVGSPYQTSLSEAHQVKYLYALSMSRGVKGKGKKVIEEFQWCEQAVGVAEPLRGCRCCCVCADVDAEEEDDEAGAGRWCRGGGARDVPTPEVAARWL